MLDAGRHWRGEMRAAGVSYLAVDLELLNAGHDGCRGTVALV